MQLKLFPVYVGNSSSHKFNRSELLRIRSMFTGWKIPDSDLFGPYELLNFTLLDPYKDGKSQTLLMICWSAWWYLDLMHPINKKCLAA